MKCSYCKGEIKNEQHMVTTPPDGDCYHNACYRYHLAEHEAFINNLHNEEWYKKNYPELNKDK